MHGISRFVIGHILFLAGAATGFAQAGKTANSQSPTPTVTAYASTERVRFTAPSSVVQIHLEVYTETAVKLFDLELKVGNVLDWPLQDGQAARLNPGSYICVLTVKSLSGRISQKLGAVNIRDQQVKIEPLQLSMLSAQQAQAVGPIEGDPGITVLEDDEPQTTTVIAHNGEEGQIVRGRGALSFRIGDFFKGTDSEQMRLSTEGNLGIGIAHPQVRLDVDGLIRSSQGIVFPDGTVQFSAASRTLGARSSRSGHMPGAKQDVHPEA